MGDKPVSKYDSAEMEEAINVYIFIKRFWRLLTHCANNLISGFHGLKYRVCKEGNSGEIF